MLITTDRHTNVPVGDVIAQMHGWFWYLANHGQDTRAWRLVRLPELAGPFDKEFHTTMKSLHQFLERDAKEGYLPLPVKAEPVEDKENFMLLVHNSSPFGKFIANLTKEQKELLYKNGASECQYGFQPFDRALTEVPIRTFDEGKIDVTLSEFKDILAKKGISFDEFAKDKEESRSVGFGDGQLYAAPDSPIYTELPPEEIRGMSKRSINAVKVNGKMRGNPFIHLKGEVTKCTWKQWKYKCVKAGVPSTFKGLLVNEHGIKNKIKFELGRDLIFDVGYFNDNRQFEGKTQIFGNQVYRRSHNIKDRLRYSHGVESLVSNVCSAIAEADVRKLVSAFYGDSKVYSNTPYYRNMLKLVAKGWPITNIDGYQVVIPNMLRKKAGRLKIPGSTRVVPKASFGYGITECGLTPSQAKRLGAKIGSVIVMNRSPSSAGFPAPTFKVVSVKEPCFSINPIIYAIFAAGDFDGDTVALYPNTGVTEMNHSIVNILNVLFEKPEQAMVEQADSLYNTAVDNTKQYDYSKLHPFIPPFVKMLQSKATVGVVDNIVTRFSKANNNPKQERIMWNHVAQIVVTRLKHVDEYLASPEELANAAKDSSMKLAVLDKLHFFLNGRDPGACDVPTKIPMGNRVLAMYNGMDFKALKKADTKYARLFHKKALEHFDDYIEALKEEYPDIVETIFNLRNGKVARWNGVDYTLLNDITPGGYTHTIDQYGREVELDSFRTILNPPRDDKRRKTERFNNLVNTVNALANLVDDPAERKERAIVTWQVVYLIALTEPFKYWLMSNHVNDEVSTIVGNMVAAIGSDCGFDEVITEE